MQTAVLIALAGILGLFGTANQQSSVVEAPQDAVVESTISDYAQSVIADDDMNTAAQETSAVAVVLAIDTSDSMYGTPLDRAKEAAIVFLEELDPNIPVAVVTFSSQAELVADFTTNRANLTTAIEGLNTGGVTALYDGSLLAVETATQARAQERVVVLLGDGAEYGEQSAALPEAARELAVDSDVVMYTVGLGFGADRTYLEDLATETNGELFEAATPDELLAYYLDLSRRITEQAEVAQTLTAANTDVIPAAQASSELPQTGGGEVAVPIVGDPSGSALGTGLNVAEAGAGETVPGASIAESGPVIPPISDTLLELDLNNELADEDEEVASGLAEGTSAAAGGEGELEEAVVPVADVLDSGILPISVTIENEDQLDVAELSLNGYSLQIFAESPLEYDLNMAQLESGLYRLTLSTVYENGVVSSGFLDFEIVEVETPGGTILREAQVDGGTVPFTLEFTTAAGLEPIEEVEVVIDGPSDEITSLSLIAVISRPINDVLPPGLMEQVGKSRPVAATVIILFITVTLLPQGVFTLVWMLYTWNNPAAAEAYASPTTYEEPHYKFTALVPARKEEEVIYETVMKVDAVNYPEHLKETLVLIRDQDDDDTIAEVRRAMNDLGNKPNLRLITFTGGPKNKPNGLNRGFAEGTGDVFCIFDAEDHPHEEIYHIVNTTMIRRGADIVQSGVQLMTHFNQHGREAWFAALNVLEYFFWFKSGLHCFTREFSVTPLGGNTVFGKREWLEEIGFRHHRWDEGHEILEIWDEQCLTEDADLGIRLTNVGASIQIVYTAEHATQEETPDSVEQFIKQRTRWMQGFYEIFRKGDWLGMPMMKQKIVGVYILLNSLLQASLVLYLPMGIYIALTQEVPVPFAIVSWVPIYLLFLQLVAQLVGVKQYADAYGIHMPRGYRLKMMIYYYPYQLLLAASAARAVGRFLAGTNNWEKTSHSGAHRTGTAAPRPSVSA